MFSGGVSLAVVEDAGFVSDASGPLIEGNANVVLSGIVLPLSIAEFRAGNRIAALDGYFNADFCAISERNYLIAKLQAEARCSLES